MLGWLFGKKKKPSAVQMAMPLLASADGVTQASIVAAWKGLFPSLPPLVASGEPETDKGGGGTGADVMSFECAGVTAMVMLMPMPIPSPEVKEAAAMSWMWKKERTASLSSYGAHAIVTALGGEETLENAVTSATLVTRVIAAVLIAAGRERSVGVYWGNGSVVHAPEMFVGAAKDLLPNGPTPMLWVNVLASADSPQGPYSLSTIGMGHFGLDEMEIVNAGGSIGDLRMRLYEAAAYLMQQGPVFKDGQTFRRSESERIKIRVGKSKLGKPGRVVRLEM